MQLFPQTFTAFSHNARQQGTRPTYVWSLVACMLLALRILLIDSQIVAQAQAPDATPMRTDTATESEDPPANLIILTVGENQDYTTVDSALAAAQQHLRHGQSVTIHVQPDDDQADEQPTDTHSTSGIEYLRLNTGIEHVAK